MDLTTAYNYDSFVEEKIRRWMNFSASPPVGTPAPDFELQALDGDPAQLSSIWKKVAFAIIEFGSLT